MAIPIPIPEESCTADEDGTTLSCDSKPPEQQPQEPPEQQPPEQQPQEPEQTQGDPEEAGKTEGIRTTPIPIPGGSQAKQQRPQQPPQHQQQQAQQPSGGGGGPGMRNLVRFLNNPEGVVTNNDSAYLRTMYSSDSANLVYKSAMNSGAYY